MIDQQIHILLADDDNALLMLMKEYMEERGFMVDTVADGRSAKQKVDRSVYDVCIFDVRMPYMTGVELTQYMRERGDTTPILLYSQLGEKEDQLKGYAAGADDYIVKPQSMEIVIAKLKAITRRLHSMEQSDKMTFTWGTCCFDAARRRISEGEKSSELSSRENEILLALARAEGKLVQRKHILQTVWHDNSVFASRSMTVIMNYLRHKLEPFPHLRINNMHGKGYQLVVIDLNDEKQTE